MAKEEIIESDDEFISLDDDDIEESEEVDESSLQEEDASLDEPESNNKILYILIAVFTILAFALLGFLLYLYLDKKEVDSETNKTEAIIENIQNRQIVALKTESYEEIVQKAKKLYKEGKREEALAIYNDLSRYNQALSFYNIGVAKLKKASYEEAIDAFSHAITHEKLYFESALNIAITAFKKGDSTLFQTYLIKATKALPSRTNAPLYSYYRTLIDYYRGFYAEALVPLRHQTSTYYQKEQNQLLSKLYSAFDNHQEAIKVIEKNDLPDDFLTLGLLYANQEEYTLADKYLLKAAELKKKPLHENLALALVYNKMGLFKKSADLLQSTYGNYKDKTTTIYPIQVSLKASLFDPVAAQKDFQKNLFFNDRNKFSLIFYFAPYRLMSPKQTIENINKGATNIYVDAFKPALNTLTLSSKISDANIEITKGIKAALDENLYQASTIFQEGIQKYPSSAELHYNLALTYAKRYDFQKAYKHFKRSAILDTNNYYAPIFADFCATLLYKERDNSLNELDEKLHSLAPIEDKERLQSLIAIARGDIITGVPQKSETLFDDILSLIQAQTVQDYSRYKKSAKTLLNKIPDNLIANILHLDATHDKQEIKAYAKEIQATLTKPSLNYHPLYSGHAFVKELYIEMLNIAGVVSHAKRLLENHLREVGTHDIASLQALAYSDIYLQEFDQAYAIYNNLIDTQHQQDSNTLFLAAIASIGASHHENAIALLELAKLTNKSNLESRFALGILYHEAKNLEGAAIQYAKIGDGGFHSRYFSFNLDKSHLK
jgi:tetratricopeptide (TPR) repeat protein